MYNNQFGSFQPNQAFNPFQNYMNYAQQTQEQSQNVLPPQQILRASGKTSIDMLKMSPNSEALIVDTTAPLIWQCTSDSLGNVTAVAWDISRHVSEPPTAPVDISGLEARVKNIETLLASIAGGNGNGEQSNGGAAEPKQDARPARKPWADQENIQ